MDKTSKISSPAIFSTRTTIASVSTSVGSSSGVGPGIIIERESFVSGSMNRGTSA